MLFWDIGPGGYQKPIREWQCRYDNWSTIWFGILVACFFIVCLVLSMYT